MHAIKRSKGAIGIFLFFLVFLLIRLYRIGYSDLWYDEIYTVIYAKSPWKNWNAPLYWLILHYWTKLFGFSEAALRLPSAFFGAGSVIALYFTGRELFGRRAAAISSVLLGLSPFHIWYAQEARDYSLLTFCGIVSTFMLVKALRTGRGKYRLAFILASAAGFYSSYFFALLFGAQVIAAMFYARRRPAVKDVFLFPAALLPAAVRFPLFINKFRSVAEGFWIPEPVPLSLLITLENYILGYNGTTFSYAACNVVILCVFVLLFKAALDRVDLRGPAVFCVVLFTAPAAAAYAFSKLFFPVYLDRGLMVASPYLYLALGAGLAYAFKTAQKILLGALLVILFFGVFNYFTGRIEPDIRHHTGAYLKRPVKNLVRFMADNAEPGDVLSYANESVIFSFDHYSGYRFPMKYHIFAPGVSTSAWNRPVRASERTVPHYAVKDLDFTRLWVIYSDWARSGGLDEASRTVKERLGRELVPEFEREIDGVWLYRYVKK